MKGIEFRIVDVFAEKPLSGNQLAVFLDAGALTTTEMQALAREIYFAETTFVTSNDENNGGYPVRIFTPAQEIPFAGHPTLGSAFVIREELAQHLQDKLTLNLGVGPIQVQFEKGESGQILWMHQIEPQFGNQLKTEELASVLSLNASDFDPRFPIQEVSTGLPHIIVPLKNLAALRRVRIVRHLYDGLIENRDAKAIMVFCPEAYTEKHDLSVRMFSEEFGIAEDPATGSGNGCLAGYLVQHKYFGTDTIDIRTGQGYEIARPSTLYLKACRAASGIEVKVGGKVAKVAEGRLT